MSPFRVPHPQTISEIAADQRAWQNFGVPVEHRIPDRTNLCEGALRGTADMACCQYAGWQKDGRGYCQWHRPPGSERR